MENCQFLEKVALCKTKSNSTKINLHYLEKNVMVNVTHIFYETVKNNVMCTIKQFLNIEIFFYKLSFLWPLENKMSKYL